LNATFIASGAFSLLHNSVKREGSQPKVWCRRSSQHTVSWYVEGFGSLLEASGTVLMPMFYFLGLLSLPHFVAFMFLAAGYGTLLSIGSILLEEMTVACCSLRQHLWTLLLFGRWRTWATARYLHFPSRRCDPLPAVLAHGRRLRIRVCDNTFVRVGGHSNDTGKSSRHFPIIDQPDHLVIVVTPCRSAQTFAVNSVIPSLPDTGAAADDSGDKG
jgi:hypothetical protein